MEKLKFSKEEIRNLHKMLVSSDEENHTMALSGLQGVDIDDSIGELILLYKYGNAHPSSWQNNCPLVYSKLNELLGDFTSGSQTLAVMSNNKASKDSIELFLEFFIKDVTSFLNDMGYPMEKLKIDIKLKDDK